MSFFQVNWSSTTTTFNVHSVQGGNAAELATRLNAAITAAADAGETDIVDLYVSGAGAGLDWEAWFVTSASPGGDTISIGTDAGAVVAAEAGNPAELRLGILAAIAAFPSITSVFKIEVAGAGIDPTYVAVALVSASGGPVVC